MKDFENKQINSLFRIDIDLLVEESKEDGFRFLERLVNDYKMGLIAL